MKCRTCSFPIVFVRMRTVRAMPVDPNPDELGNVAALRLPNGRLVDGHVLGKGDSVPDADYQVFMPHFATCSAPKKKAPAGSRRHPAAEPTPTLL